MHREFMQTLDDDQYELLLKKAIERNMSVQKLIRHIIVPDWVKKELKK